MADAQHGVVASRQLLALAVLACGPDAVLSHRSAAALWSLRPSAPSQTDVTVPGRTRAGQDGIAVHNVRALHPRDRTGLDGIRGLTERPGAVRDDVARALNPDGAAASDR